MTDTTYDLVHMNFAIGRYALDHPDMADFARQIDVVNRLAAASPGFIWTPEGDEAGDAAIVFGHPRTLANMSTWRSIEDLWRFTYSGAHHAALGRRREWFEPPTGPVLALWWAPGGTRPTWQEAKERLNHLAANGPNPFAFTFKESFDQHGQRIAGLVRGIRVSNLTRS